MGYSLVKMRRLFLYKNKESFEIERMTPTLASITETLPWGNKKFFENFVNVGIIYAAIAYKEDKTSPVLE